MLPLFSYHLLDGIKILSSCRSLLVDAIIKRYGRDMIAFCGIDCDKWSLLSFLILRDIAKYAREHDALVLTGDTDFCIFEIPGVVFLDDVITTKEDFVSIVTLSKIYANFRVDQLQLFFFIYLQGNDIFKGKDWKKSKELFNTVKYVQANAPTDLVFTDPRHGSVDLTPIKEQYSLVNGVPYPFNMIATKVSEMEFFADLGITEGRCGCGKPCVELLKKACDILNDPRLVNIHKIVFSPIQVAPLIHPVEYKDQSICMLLL